MKSKVGSLPNLESLTAFLHPRFQGRVAIIGIGNRFWGDDGAGPELITSLKEKWETWELESSSRAQRLFVDAGECPEDWFIRILDLKPEVIIVVDAVDLRAEPGSVAILKPESLPESFCFSTHRFSLKSLLELWEKNGSETLVLAIQPETLGFGQGLSYRVGESIDHLVGLLAPPHTVMSSFPNPAPPPLRHGES
ncbi:MAG: hydrogenase maturation protease [Syntrophales bacterium]|nr:hydrogenase maturation protease [Syntrophales bacterium]